MGRPPKNAFAEETAVRLLHAAAEAFGRLGYTKARLGDIAERVGIRRSSLLYHFGNKDTLYSEVVRHAFDEFRQAVRNGARAEGEPAARIGHLVRTLTELARTRTGVVRLVMRAIIEPHEPGRALIQEEWEAMMGLLEETVADIVGSERPAAYPLRPAIATIVSSYLVQTPAGDLGTDVWGVEDHTAALAVRLLLR